MTRMSTPSSCGSYAAGPWPSWPRRRCCSPWSPPWPCSPPPRTPASRSRRAGTTLAALSGHGGGTEAFAVGASFVGFFVFVTFIALIATEFSGGTFRALLLRDPHRMRVIVGKLAGILVVAAGVVAVIEVATFVASLVVAPAQDVVHRPVVLAGQPRCGPARLRHRVRRGGRDGRSSARRWR